MEHNCHSESSHFNRSGSFRHPAAGGIPPRIDGRQACGDRGLLGTQRDLSVTIGGVEADVAKPCPDDIDLDAASSRWTAELWRKA